MSKTMTIAEVKEMLREILDFVGGSDSEVADYIKELIRSL